MARPNADAPIPAPADPQDVYLNYEGVQDTLERLGLKRPTERAVKSMADDKKLPFFKGLDGRRYISRKALIAALEDRQTAAELAHEQLRRANRTKRRGGKPAAQAGA